MGNVSITLKTEFGNLTFVLLEEKVRDLTVNEVLFGFSSLGTANYLNFWLVRQFSYKSVRVFFGMIVQINVIHDWNSGLLS